MRSGTTEGNTSARPRNRILGRLTVGTRAGDPVGVAVIVYHIVGFAVKGEKVGAEAPVEWRRYGESNGVAGSVGEVGAVSALDWFLGVVPLARHGYRFSTNTPSEFLT